MGPVTKTKTDMRFPHGQEISQSSYRLAFQKNTKRDVTEGPRNVHKVGIITVAFPRYYSGDLDNDNKTNGECTTHGKDEKYI